jgi:hypothetical protein
MRKFDYIRIIVALIIIVMILIVITILNINGFKPTITARDIQSTQSSGNNNPVQLSNTNINSNTSNPSDIQVNP